jgi:uncharacterized OB-fold protein
MTDTYRIQELEEEVEKSKNLFPKCKNCGNPYMPIELYIECEFGTLQENVKMTLIPEYCSDECKKSYSKELDTI